MEIDTTIRVDDDLKKEPEKEPTAAIDEDKKAESDLFLKPALPLNTTSSVLSPKREAADNGDNEEVSTDISSKMDKQLEIEMRYNEPIWARMPTSSRDNFYIEVIKDGSIIENIALHSDEENRKSYVAIGRFDPCDIKLEHPSVSRFHAVLQYGECTRGQPQWFIFDMNSTHGVKVNKRPIRKNTYVPLFGGHVFQIAGSTRIFVLAGGPKIEKDEAENDEKKNKQEMQTVKEENKEKSEDQQEEDEKHRFYDKDPLYWLEKYFEREGMPMSFKFTKTAEESNSSLSLTSSKKKAKMDEDSGSNWICTIELVSDVSLSGGTVVTAMAPSKRLSQIQCALLACERLDEACLLQISSLWNKRKNYTENDFYEEDEDTFFDRTGQLEEQREKRKKRYESDPNDVTKAKTYADLLKELEENGRKLEVIKSEIDRLSKKDKCLDDAISADTKPALNFSTRMAISQMKGKEKKLMEEKVRLTKLAEIAKPSSKFTTMTAFPSIIKSESTADKPVKVENEVDGNLLKKEPNEDDINGSAEMPAKKERIVEEGSPEIGVAEQRKGQQEKAAAEIRPPPADMPSPSSAKIQQQNEAQIEREKEERFYAPAMPTSKSDIQTITPKFGILTKEELIQMKLVQKQKEKDVASGRGGGLLEQAKRRASQEAELREEEETVYDIREKYATWVPPEDQSGDGTTRLNKKFAGKY